MAHISNNSNPLLGKNLLSIKDLDKESVKLILEESAKMNELFEGKKRSTILENKILANLFFEPSTRTRLSFESAMYRLGGNVMGFSDSSSTSTVKGETLSDTIKVISSYADVLVIRHPGAGSAAEAAKVSSIPVINGGDGAAEHPTQALIDLFTIKMQKHKMEGMKVAIVGDMKNTRPIHSFAYGVAMFNNDITFVSPEQLKVPAEMKKDLTKTYGIKIEESDSLEDIKDADIVYIPRIQKERFPDQKEYERFAHYYTINKKFLSRANDDIIVMSPLPRLTEISTDIDQMKNSVYFKQATYGIPVRMAILKMILSGV